VACLRSGWLTSGPRVAEFEQDFARYLGVAHALAVSSCTAALHLALEAVGVGPGDEVVTSPMTFAATASVVEHLGARPVFVDCEPDTLNLDAARLEAAFTPRTKAVLPVHFAGQACDMDAVLALAHARGIAVIEDAAHALPTRYKGRLVGTLGDLTCFSFYVTKTITTGEGGMVVTDRDDYAERIRTMRLHGLSKDAWKRYGKGGTWMYEIQDAGYKYNLPDIAAAIGVEQLRRCDGFLAQRRAIAERYDAAFAGLPGVRTPAVDDRAGHAWHLYVIQLEPDAFAIDRAAFIEELAELGVGASVHFIPLHRHPYYRAKYGYTPADLPVASAAFERVVSLPLYAAMSDDAVDHVVRAVTTVARRSRR
jgi:perosamine synthetase